MSVFCVALRAKSADNDVRAAGVLADIHRRGLTHISSVRTTRLFFLKGDLGKPMATRLATELLVDPVIETFRVFEGMTDGLQEAASVEVHCQPGVMDPVAQTTLRTARRMVREWGGDPKSECDVRTAWRYALVGVRDHVELESIARNVLANDCIETAYIDGFDRKDPRPTDFPTAPATEFELREVRLRELDDSSLSRLSREGHLFLSLEEMATLRAHYRKLGREPTDIELETFAQTWSEHCVHKTLKSAIDYKGQDFGRAGDVEAHFDNLLADTIVRATRELDRDWCLSVFEDNAGVIAFDDDWGVAFKVETHNHPSAIEPYGGAATGTGGCIRDIIGCGLGAKPIASTDVFCLAPPDWPEDRLQTGVLHPRRVLAGVVAGVRDYGNRMGIPTVNGAIHFEPRYLTNPLVFCGCLGLIPRDKIVKRVMPGDAVVVAGGRTGRDGIHGATFSSSELTDTHVDEFAHAVQIGNPIEEKKVLDAVLAARDHESGCLYSSITDCGAGGLSSAVGEMGEELGADIELADVPLKYAGLRYDEIWISEAQERMVLSVPQEKLAKLLSVFEAEDVEAAVIGRFTGDGLLRLRYDGVQVGEIEMQFLHNGLPRTSRAAEWYAPEKNQIQPTEGSLSGQSLGARLLAELGHLNVASKEWVIRQYDHEVQAGSVVKPLAGPGQGPADAAVLRPRLDSDRGIVVGCGLCPELADDDPYEMAVSAVDEALRNVICSGGDPNRTAILDNFCWGSVDSPRALGALVRACRGAYDAAVAYGLPFISGKDSLNNQFSQSEEEARRVGMPACVSIPDTLLISAVSVIADVSRCVTMDLKQPGNRLYCVGGFSRRSLENSAAVHRRVADWIREGLVASAHDVSDGGLLVAVAEMCIAGDCGAVVQLDDLARFINSEDDLFTSQRCCYVLECADEKLLKADDVVVIGSVHAGATLTIERAGERLADVPVQALADAWRRPLSSVAGV